ncbi:MAG: hypothetical protein Tsb0027_15470 [Wenzhouxiangellaceae bacterium]
MARLIEHRQLHQFIRCHTEVSLQIYRVLGGAITINIDKRKSVAFVNNLDNLTILGSYP